MLHIINKSPYERDNLESCLRHASKDNAVLLIEDGVYAALQGSAAAKTIGPAMDAVSFYVLDADLEARGIKDKVMDGVTQIDYAGFVDLVTESDRVQSWL